MQVSYSNNVFRPARKCLTTIITPFVTLEHAQTEVLLSVVQCGYIQHKLNGVNEM